MAAAPATQNTRARMRARRICRSGVTRSCLPRILGVLAFLVVPRAASAHTPCEVGVAAGAPVGEAAADGVGEEPPPDGVGEEPPPDGDGAGGDTAGSGEGDRDGWDDGLEVAPGDALGVTDDAGD